MDVNMSGIAAQANTLNRLSVGQDIFLKTQEKTEEGEAQRKLSEPKTVEGPKSSKQGRIDFYA